MKQNSPLEDIEFVRQKTKEGFTTKTEELYKICLKEIDHRSSDGRSDCIVKLNKSVNDAYYTLDMQNVVAKELAELGYKVVINFVDSTITISWE